jgi:hypothetical protein
VNACLYPHDAEEVLKIRLSERNYEDYIAWHYEKSGVFTVKSAYHLALELEQGDRRQEGYSDRADGSRVLY